jgi:hypothetical protein
MSENAAVIFNPKPFEFGASELGVIDSAKHGHEHPLQQRCTFDRSIREFSQRMTRLPNCR